MSGSDIDKGVRWALDLANQLEGTKMGIICLTPENLTAPWILFEAGALSKAVNNSLVCPYLFDLEPSAVQGPLSQFQATKACRDDTKLLVQSINRGLEQASLADSELEQIFDVWWPHFEKRLQLIASSQDGMKAKPIARTERDMLSEVLEILRAQERRQALSSQSTTAIKEMYNSVVEYLNGLGVHRLPSKLPLIESPAGEQRQGNDLSA
jgi:hypothetical protein